MLYPKARRPYRCFALDALSPGLGSGRAPHDPPPLYAGRLAPHQRDTAPDAPQHRRLPEVPPQGHGRVQTQVRHDQGRFRPPALTVHREQRKKPGFSEPGGQLDLSRGVVVPAGALPGGIPGREDAPRAALRAPRRWRRRPFTTQAKALAGQAIAGGQERAAQGRRVMGRSAHLRAGWPCRARQRPRRRRCRPKRKSAARPFGRD